MSELAPPRKSVELEDPGAHELGIMSSQLCALQALISGVEHSENDSDVFSDAQEGRRSSSSGNNSPIPTTRVEKVGHIEDAGQLLIDLLRRFITRLMTPRAMAKFQVQKHTGCGCKTPYPMSWR